MPLFPGTLLPWIQPRFVDANGDALALGTISSFEAGTAAPLETYRDPNFAVANPVIITLDGNGQLPWPCYLLPQGYKFTVKDVDGVVQPHYPFDNVENIGQIFAENFGVYQFQGAKNVVSGYEIDPDEDHFVTVNSSGGPNPCEIFLCASALARWPLTIKNMGTIPLQLVPSGADTIDTVGATLAIIPAAVSPLFPSVVLLPDAISAWLVQASHALWLP